MKAPLRNSLLSLGTLLKWLLYACVLIALVVITNSLIVFLLAIVTFIFLVDCGLRRRRHYVSSFNSSLRAVSRSGAPMGTAARAFAQSGPLRYQCQEFGRRVLSGEAPLEAAIAAQLPLEISTALTLELEFETSDTARQRLEPSKDESAIRQSAVSVSVQFFYLAFVSFFSVAAMVFFATFIQPVLHAMYDEASISHLANASPLPITWGLGVLILLSISLVIFPLLFFTGLITSRLPKWCVPLLPAQARPNADALFGIAAGIDAGSSLQHVCHLGQKISHGRTRACFARALQSIESGASESAAITAGGWVNANEAAWLDGTPPQRMTALMRSMSRQNLRTAYANLNWLMAFLFPAVLLGIAAIIAPWAYSFFFGLNMLTLESSKPI